MPLASLGAISRDIWSKTPEAEQATLLTTKMRTYGLVTQGNNISPGALVLSVSTGAPEPKSFLTSRMNLATAIPKIELLIHSMGSYLVAPGQFDNLHGHTLAFVGEQIEDQLLLTFLEPDNGGASLAFQAANVVVPIKPRLMPITPKPRPRCSSLAEHQQGRQHCAHGRVHDPSYVGPLLHWRWHPQGYTLDKKIVSLSDRGLYKFIS